MAGLKEPLLFDDPSVLRDDRVINFICPDINDGSRTLKGACLVNILDNQYVYDQPHVKKVQTGVSDFSSDFKMSTSN